ncbi:MAG: cob(I)yrinic acid a,c-diamide adenosyltransferase [Chloroflexota bacterium]|nr:cob(I)yrinic acid a,c-diamide adenosyltransferase [Chloroflexota bacterium]
MRYYTTKGDTGGTDLLGERVSKDDLRIEMLGALDETTSALGLGRAQATTAAVGDALVAAQRDLYQIMAELAFVDATRPDRFRLSPDRVTALESATDGLAANIELPREFILPGETVPGAALDLARTIARRAERVAVALNHAGQMPNPEILRYLNRLSSLLFIAARVEDSVAGAAPRQAKADISRPEEP